jgi:hypothetical protein
MGFTLIYGKDARGYNLLIIVISSNHRSWSGN